VIVGVLLCEPPEEQVSVPCAADPDPDPPDPPELDGQVATDPTEETTPGVVRLFGRLIVTRFPGAMLVCCDACRATCT
jgi:hypothetical protein